MSPKSRFEVGHAPPPALIGISRCRDGPKILPKLADAAIITSAKPSIRWMSVETRNSDKETPPCCQLVLASEGSG